MTSELLFAQGAGVPEARNTLSALSTSGLLRLNGNNPALDTAPLDALRGDAKPIIATIIAARNAGDFAAERAALSRLAEGGHYDSTFEMAYLAFREAGDLTEEAVYWYRVSLFLGEKRSAWSLGAFFLRKYAAGQSVTAPEGVLS